MWLELMWIVETHTDGHTETKGKEMWEEHNDVIKGGWYERKRIEFLFAKKANIYALHYKATITKLL